LYRFGIVVLSLDKLAAATGTRSCTVQARNVIAFSAVFANASAAKAVHKQRKIYVDIDNEVDIRNFIKRLRLHFRAREPVEHIAVFAIGSRDALLYDFASNFVGYELAFIDKRFSKHTDFRLVFDVFSKNVARGNMRQGVFVRKFGCERSFACAGRAE
jgi:hypothetical protein